jgi:tetratricopeptide (TPR) repeat protein
VGGFLTVALLIGIAPATADVLHLRGGGEIRTREWWVDGDKIHYRSPAGTVGIPRDEVLRIEESEEPSRGAASRGSGRTPDAGTSGSMTEDELEALRSLLDEGREALELRDFETASSRYREALRQRQDLDAARVGYALAEMALDRDGVALSVVLEGLARNPACAELHEVLGDLRNREERVEDAVGSWEEAFRLSPNDRLREKILKGQRELHAGRHYTFSTAPHFNVRYDHDLDPDLAGEIVDYLEEQYWVLSDRFRHAPSQPITVLLYPMEQFRDVTQSADWVGGVYDGKIRVPLGGVRRLDPRGRALLVHELTHAVIYSKTRGNCPRWLHEGLAQIMEGRPFTRADRQQVLQSLRGIEPQEWDEAGLSYPAALSLASYLRDRRGFDTVVLLLDGLADGQDIDQALRNTYAVSYDQLCRDWAESLARGERR